MKYTGISFLIILLSGGVLAQRPSADEVVTNKGPFTIQPLNHATMAFTWQGKTIYIDPNGGAKTFEGVAVPDLILITDIHGDHFNPETLGAINTSKATLVVPQAVADKLSDDLKKKAVVLANGQSKSIKDISIMAVPMYLL